MKLSKKSLKKSKSLPKKQLRKKSLKRLSDSVYREGDFYADADVQGRVQEVTKDFIKVEYMDENGDIQVKQIDLSEVKDSKNDLYNKCKELVSILGAEKLFWDLFEYLPSSTIEDFIDTTQGLYFDQVEDSLESRRAAEFALDANKIIDLYINGEIEVAVPSGIPTEEFVKDCIDLITEMWGEPDVNFEYGDTDIDYVVEGNTVKFFTN